MAHPFNLLLRCLVQVCLLVAPAAATNDAHHSPLVTVRNGTYAGVHSPGYRQDFFLGIPYAQVPGRFTVAKGLRASWNGIRNAGKYPPHCVGYGSDHVGYETSEDCLFLNVIRPAGVSAAANLPVAVWIHGGGLLVGGSADKRYNLSFIVERSVDMGTPIIGVSLNYRLSAYGFLPGREALNAGATNIGFRDQRLALRWLQENIDAFGGSPEKVTIFGESAGAESVSAQVLAYNGRDDQLFRGAIGQSGFGSVIRRSPYNGGFNETERLQASYDNLVSNTSCARFIGTAESLDCIRKAPIDELHRALNGSDSGPWPPTLDGDFFRDYTTHQLRKGNFRKVPVMIGINTDEGGNFSLDNGKVDTDEDVRKLLCRLLLSKQTEDDVDALVKELMHLYPNVQSVGIPSLIRWPHVIQPNDTMAQMLGAQYRRMAAIYGDMMFHYARRRANLAWSDHGVPSYSYRFDVLVNGQVPYFGSSHFQEVAFVFRNWNADGYDVNPFGGDDTEYTAKAKALSTTMATAWINFVNHLDPNGKDGLGLANNDVWPKYDRLTGSGVGNNIVWDVNGNYVELDDWRLEGMNWMITNGLSVFGS
ncbi:carboxylesterase family protein [Drechmeria coniospora]|uniref:Carboxylic ester hydrolase n=1 Tax=Drechmeria coniospora TaxID=98403 RepID=A0A151GD50_DRECN|nr:carboxylesterase family protein [Drechmeria coniospora]KYK54974.1 carboxylesterase family protein [Drechmeria coniospora]